MEKAKYLPDEIDRMIDEEISRIDAANSAVHGDLPLGNSAAPSRRQRIFSRLCARFKRQN